MLKIVCPKCKCEVEISEDKLGEVVTCDSCKTSFVTESPSGKDISSASPLSDGTFREVEVDGVFYSLKMLRRLRKRYCVFIALFLFQFACLFTLVCSMVTQRRRWTGGLGFALDALILFLLTFFPLLVSYVLFMRALKKPAYFILVILLYIPVFFFFREAFVPMGIFCLLYLIGCLYPIGRADKVFNSAIISKGNSCSGMMKRISPPLFSLLVSLIVSAFFLGSVRSDIGLCTDCGIWSETESICFWGMKLTSSSVYKQTVFPLFLDPEHQCRHGNGKVFVSRAEEQYMLKNMGCSLGSVMEEMLDNMLHYSSHPISSVFVNGEPSPAPEQEEREKWDWFRGFMKNMDNLKEDSLLHVFLLEQDSQSFARHMILNNLSSKELDALYHAIGPEVREKIHPDELGDVLE